MASAGAKVFFCPRLAININLPIEKRILDFCQFYILKYGEKVGCIFAIYL